MEFEIKNRKTLKNNRMNEKFKKILDDIKTSQKEIEVLPADNKVTLACKERLFINWDSLLGVVLENTGGIIIDHWIRLYGTGKLNFIERNSIIPLDELAIAEDILGGLFILLENSNIGYFAPDCLEIEDTELKIGQFLYWCLHGDTDLFYVDYRWKNWKKDVAKLNCDNGIAFYPFLFTKADCIDSRMRKEVPMAEIIGIEFDVLKQLGEN